MAKTAVTTRRNSSKSLPTLTAATTAREKENSSALRGQQPLLRRELAGR